MAATSRAALTAERIAQRRGALVYAETRGYQDSARRLGLDRRTVRGKVEAHARAGGDAGESAE